MTKRTNRQIFIRIAEMNIYSNILNPESPLWKYNKGFCIFDFFSFEFFLLIWDGQKNRKSMFKLEYLTFLTFLK